MTTVEILYRYTTPPSVSVSFALAGTRDVYGVRRIHVRLPGALQLSRQLIGVNNSHAYWKTGCDSVV